MNDDLDLERRVAAWLDDQFPAREPDGLLRSVIDTTSRRRPRPTWLARLGGQHFSSTSSRAGFGPSPQRRSGWPARRLPHMNTSFKIAFAAVVTLMVTLLGLDLVPRHGGIGANLPIPSPTASPSPAPTLPPSGELAPGTYRADYLTYTVPAGWNSSEGWATYKDPTEGALLVSPWGPFLTVYSDPCHWQSTGAAVGPTVDDEVAALVAQNRGATVTPIDVTIDGFSGKELDLTVPLDVTIATIANCDGGMYKTWTDGGGDQFNQGPGQHDLLDILDVGGTTVAIDRVYWPATTAADRAEQQAIFDSIRITPPASAPAPTAAPTP